MGKKTLVLTVLSILLIPSTAFAGVGGIYVDAGISTPINGDNNTDWMASKMLSLHDQTVRLMVPDYNSPVKSNPVSNLWKFQKIEYAYHPKEICGNQTIPGPAINLIESISVHNLSGDKYQIKGRIDSLEGYQVKTIKTNMPNQPAWETCQVFTPKILTARQTWTVEAKGKMIDFKSTLNGKILTVKTVGVMPIL